MFNKMSIANRKGGFYRSLEVSRDDSHLSETVLNDNFLTKTNNYIVQVQHFISSNVQRLNTIDEVMFQVFRRGGVNDTVDDVQTQIPDTIAQFRPSSYFSIVELGRQLTEYVRVLNDYLNAQGGVNIRHIDGEVDGAGKWRFGLSIDFSSLYYIQVGELTQKATGFRKYIFAVNDGATDIYNSTDNSHLALIDVLGFFTYNGGGMPTHRDALFIPVRPLSAFDMRVSLDVVATFPISTKPAVLNGIETNDYVLARFPTSAHRHTWQEIDMVNGSLQKTITIKERINAGLEDMTENNTESIGNHLLNGKIKHCNFRLENRYLVDGKIVRQPCDFTNGFFTIKLLFSKKES
jgi:hypothetical protein